ncbi:hypothetical protein [Roseicitreum antarcticum]|uniref:DUF4124 domain-containing protein n=1 Tax=Roseicitreum antarcticum TaxID=564137 RepID=A0A1H3GAA5_9RHOB|nr:hypothetical protein [Roseicitreum antarcticum]SDX99259.1 hypothetical protein SAMN04488238_1702 [Roseicitreum antarcticum]
MKMKSLMIAAFALAALTGTASASCYGTSNVYTCTDSSGNTYNVNRYGGSTSVQGYNSSTGSTWSQNSHSYGNTTNTYGQAANGNSWNSTTNRYGSGSSTYGTDSRGRSFNSFCYGSNC